MNGWFLGAVLFMTNCNANATNPIAKLTNSTAKPTNSIANRTNSIAKATNSIAKTCMRMMSSLLIPVYTIYGIIAVNFGKAEICPV